MQKKVQMKYFKCSCNICGKRYSSERIIDNCPRCTNPVIPGIDFLDVWNYNYERIRKSNHWTF
ncbi:MAG: hypothetical protein ACXADA_08455 [Candidatus Hodarchaeales archaeon]